MISVVVLAFDEELNLPRCLDALGWCDDVLVLDSFSRDRTVEIARERGARVLQRTFDEFAAQRNWAMEHGYLRHEWVLHVDADEVVTPQLRDEMLSRLPHAREDAFRIAARMMFQGVWLKHAGQYPTYQVRLGRRDRLRFLQAGHGQREALPRERIGTLSQPLIHYSFAKGLDDWFARHNRYSSDEARHALAAREPRGAAGLPLLRDPVERRRALKRLSRRLPFRPTLRFLYTYLWRRGFLDGRAGFTYCRMLALYEYLIVLKTRELEARRMGETS